MERFKMKKILALLAVLSFSTQLSFAAPAAQANQSIGSTMNATCNRMVNDKACDGQIKFRDRALKCNKCGSLANS